MPQYSVVELLNARMEKVTKTVDLTLTRESATGVSYVDGDPDPAFAPFMPLQNYMDSELAFMKLQRGRPELAYVVALDQEIPTDRVRVQLSTETVGKLKIAKEVVFTEEDYELVRKAEMLSRMGPGGQKAAQEIRNVFMAKPAALAQSVKNTLAYLTMRAMVIGRCEYIDPRTNFAVDLSYVAQIPAGHLAATKTGTGRWSQAVTANGIQDIVDHLNVYYASFLRYPPFIGMGSVEWMNLRNQNSTRDIVARGRGLITEVGTPDPIAYANMPPPTLEEVASEISRRLSRGNGQPGAVQLLVTDAVAYRRAADGMPISSLYLPAGYYGFFWPRMAEQAVVPSAANNYAGGLATNTDVLRKDPPLENVTVSGYCIPLIMDARMIGSRNVENTAI
jgi:hypothetical protein